MENSYGVIESSAENIQISGKGYQNPLAGVAGWGETYMGATMASVLNGYEDLNSNNIEINNDVLKAVQVDLSATDLNKAISDILCDKFSSLNFIKSKRNLSLNFKSLEEIIIKDIL